MMTSNLKHRKEIYLMALNKFGSNAQLIKATGELSELLVEVAKYANGKGNITNLIDEIADAKIMIEQIEFIFGFRGEIESRIDTKLEKLKGYL